MTKKLHLLTFLMFALALALAAAAEAGGGHGDSGSDSDHNGSCRRIQICHFPPSDPANFHTIRIKANKWARHERHGDLLGSCQANCEAICDDGNACTQDVESNPYDCVCLPTPVPVSCDDGVTCTEDSCDPTDGSCVYDITCEDDNPCTANICSSGECTFPPTSGCLFPPVADGESCDDGDPTTTGDQCISGACQGELDLCFGVTCPPAGQCQQPGTCNSDTGECDYLPAEDGTTCDDGDPSTTGDQCSSGICEGEPDLCFDLTCDMPDQCELPGTCDPATGLCEYLPAADGTTCDDGDPSTTGDECSNGICEGEPPVGCTPDTACVTGGGEDGVCDAQGMCVAQCDIGIPPTGSCSVPGEMRQSRDSCGEFAECVFLGFGYVWQATPCPAGQVWDDVAVQCQATSITCTYADNTCGTGGPD